MKALARRVFQHPGVLAGYWFYRALAAWLLAAPLVGVFSGVGVGRLPNGDAQLFEQGGLFLTEAARLAGPGLLGHMASTVLSALVLACLGLIPLAVLLMSVQAGPALGPREWLGAAVLRLPRLSLLLGLALAGQAGVLVLGGLVTSSAKAALEGALDARSADFATLAVAAPFALGLVMVGIAHDLGRTTLVDGDTRFRAGLGAALSLLSRHGARLGLVWFALAAAASLLILGGARLTSTLAVERPETWRWFCVFLLHQLVVAGLVLLRAGWLGHLAIVAENHG